MRKLPLTRKDLEAAASVLERVMLTEYRQGPGDGPLFYDPDGVGDVIRRLKESALLLDIQGNYTKPGPKAEEFAICLHQLGNYGAAVNLFLSITVWKKHVLALKKPGDQYFKAVVNRLGYLGYEGLYRFANTLLKLNLVDEAKQRLLELVESTPVDCTPIRLQDVHVEALYLLQEIGVKKVKNQLTSVALKKAVDHQY